MKFDPEIGSFDFYDTDISMQAMMKGLKLGVVVRKDLTHFSVGKSILTKQFLENELKFRQKWGLAVPSESHLAKLIQEKESAMAAGLNQLPPSETAPTETISAT